MVQIWLFAVVTVFAVTHSVEASSEDLTSKLIAEGIFPDVLDAVHDLKSLNITYPSGAKVEAGNVLTPTQVKDQPQVKWEAKKGAFYTLLMTGETF